MLLAPQQALTGIFKIAPSGDVVRLVAVVGGSTLAWVLLSGINLTWVFRGRRPGFTLAIVQGFMLVVVGLIMTATGTTAGLIDAGKGILIASVAWWARPSTTKIVGDEHSFSQEGG